MAAARAHKGRANLRHLAKAFAINQLRCTTVKTAKYTRALLVPLGLLMRLMIEVEDMHYRAHE